MKTLTLFHIFLLPIIFLQSCTTCIDGVVKTKEGASLTICEYEDTWENHRNGGRSYHWNGQQDSEGKAHGSGVFRIESKTDGKWNSMIIDAEHGKIAKRHWHWWGEDGNLPSVAATYQNRADRLRKQRDSALPWDQIIKGGLALGGAAALANQGADSSIIGEYASNVMNERVPTPSSYTNNEPSALKKELLKQQRETQERLAGTRPYDRAQASNSTNPKPSTNSNYGSPSQATTQALPSLTTQKKQAQPQLSVCSFARVRRKNSDGEWDDIDIFWEYSTASASYNGDKLKAKVKRRYPNDRIQMSLPHSPYMPLNKGCFSILRVTASPGKGKKTVSYHAIGYGKDFNQSHAQALKRLKVHTPSRVLKNGRVEVEKTGKF